MINWQEDLFTDLLQSDNVKDVMSVTHNTLKSMGFDFFGWRSLLPLPLANKKVATLCAKNDSFTEKESEGEWLDTPCSRHCAKTMEPFRWYGTTSESLYHQVPDIMDEFYGCGYRGGWAQSLITAPNFYSLLWVSSKNVLAQKDHDHVDFKLQWITTAVLSRTNQLQVNTPIRLTDREKEVLRWSGDGKTADQIGMILSISHSTVNYHLRNAMAKLDAPNKTTAIVRAIFLRLLV